MEKLPKCLLLPIDGTDDSIRPVEFLRRLYPDTSDVNLILCYFIPPLPPVYAGMFAESAEMVKKKRELLQSREQDTRRIFDHARKALLNVGFSQELIQTHVQQKEMTVAKHACLLADTKKVDAVLVQKRITSNLEGFIRGSSPSALLNHCLTSPIWFTEGDVEPKKAAICIFKEEACMRIADHAGFMLSDTGIPITLLHASRAVSVPVRCRQPETSAAFAHWASSPEGREIKPYLTRAAEILMDYGIAEDRVEVTLIPSRGDTAQEILTWCRGSGTGIIGLGHSEPEGIWSFLKTSVTKNILAEFKNMAVWVTQ
jgi:nucleotide-binding universal stress UspA family protein